MDSSFDLFSSSTDTSISAAKLNLGDIFANDTNSISTSISSPSPFTSLNSLSNTAAFGQHFELPGEMIYFTEVPTKQTWKFNPIYIINQKEKQLYWQVGFDGATNELMKVYGYVDGKEPEKINRRLIVPKANRDMLAQAILEARAAYKKKYDSGYRPVYEHNTSVEVQLANKYIAPGSVNESTGKNANTNCKEFPVLVWAKLDGIRAYIKIENDQVMIRSRNHKEFHYLQKLREDLKRLFYYLPPGTILDTELYYHGWSLEKINSAVTTRLSENPNNKYIQAYILDIIPPENDSGKSSGNFMPTYKRVKVLITAYMLYCQEREGDVKTSPISGAIAPPEEIINIQNNNLASLINKLEINGSSCGSIEPLKSDALASSSPPLPTQYFEILTPMIAINHQDLAEMHFLYINHYQLEGIMIRKVHDRYAGKRNNSLLKYKKWEYDEGVVVDVISSMGQEKDLALFKLNYRGAVITVRPEGTFEYRKFWLMNPQYVLGLEYTFKFFSLTKKSNIPRFPIGVGFRKDLM